MEVLKKYVFLIVVFSSFLSTAQPVFYKKYTTDSPFDVGNGIVQLPDSTYAVTGTSGGFDENSGQAYLMLLDKEGNHLWTKSYGESGDDIGVRVFHLPGEGFYVAGYSNSTENSDFDFVVYRTNETGSLLWSKKYGGENWERLNDAHLLQDGGLILVGQVEGPTTNGRDMFIVRTNNVGDTVWTKTISTPLDDIAFAVAEISNNEIVIGGEKGNQDEVDGVLITLDLDGNQLWEKFYNQDGATSIRNIIIHNNEIYFSGHIYNEELEQNDQWLVKTDINGENPSVWQYSYASFSEFTALAVRDYTGIYAACITDAEDIEPFPEGYDAVITRFVSGIYFGNFSKKFAAFGDDIINQLIVTLDDGIAFVGTASDLEVYHSLGTVVMVGKLSKDDDWQQDADTGIDMVNLSEEALENSLFVYPNPTNELVYFSKDMKGNKFILYSQQGEEVLSGTINSSLSLSELSNGIYFLKVVGKEQSWDAKIVKQ